MNRLPVTLVVLSLAATSAAAITTSNADVDRPAQTATEALQQALGDYKNNDVVDAKKILEVLVDSPKFVDLGEEDVHSARLALGSILLQNGDYAHAEENLKLASDSDYATGIDWHQRLSASSNNLDDRDAVLVLKTIAMVYPETLGQVNGTYIAQLDGRAKQNSSLDAARFEMEEALVAAGWTPEGPGESADALEINFITTLVTRGEVSHASAIAARLIEPMSLVRLRSEKMFDVLEQSPVYSADLKGVMDRFLETRRAYVKAHPDSLAGVNALAEALLEQDRPNVSLDLVERAIIRFNASPKEAKSYDDPDKINWTLDVRSRSKMALGNIEDALKDLRAGARMPENGVPNVSQTLNLAEWLVAAEREDEALKLTDDVEAKFLSPYGAADREGVRACAFARLNRQPQLKAALDYLTEHRTDALDWPVEASLCAADFDRAASIVIAELTDPSTRADALIELQTYLERPTLPRYELEMQNRLHALAQRADVKAAIDRVGRVQSVPLARPIL